MAAEAARLFLKEGCRYLGVVFPVDQPVGLRKPYDSVVDVVSTPHQPPCTCELLYDKHSMSNEDGKLAGWHIDAGRNIGEYLLARPAEQRPDGLIITNDLVAMGLVETIRVGSNYRPKIAVQTNLQSPLI